MKYSIKSFIFGFIVCLLIIGGTVFAAIMGAKDVAFVPKDLNWDVDNVEDAINDLKIKRRQLSGVYGIKREINSSSSEWTRIGESVGKVANAQVGDSSVRNDFDNIYPWSEIKSYDYDTDNHQITAWYGESGFTLKPEGNIEVLTYIPEFYYLRVQSNGYEYVLISKDQHEDFTKSEAFSVGRYIMSGNTTRVHSKSGQTPLAGYNEETYRSYAKKLGADFGQLDYHIFIIQLLYLVEYADYNSQTKLGLGYTSSSNNKAATSGNSDILGMHSGSADDTGTTSVIYRGIEDIYGNVWQFVDGINIKNNKTYISYTPSKYGINKYNDGYIAIGYTNATSDGYISKLGYDAINPLIALSIENDESSENYIGDKSWQTTGNRVALIGGCWANTSTAGLWTWHLAVESSDTDKHCGARLIRYN